jgi:ParB/RepB/Spo0J family partition protein
MKKKKADPEVAWTELEHIHVQKGFNLRGKVKPDPELVARIQKDGVLHPIHIRNSPDGRHYLLVDGERRYQAAKVAGLAGVPVILHDSMSDEEAMLFSYRANEAQKPWTSGQKFKMFLKLHQLGWSPQKIGKTLLVSQKTVSEYLKTKEKGSLKTQEALANGAVSSRVSSRVSNLPKKKQGRVIGKIGGKGTKESLSVVKAEEEKSSPEPSATSYFLAKDAEDRCRELEKLIHEQLDLAPRHKVLRGQLEVIQVLRGKRNLEDIFPDYIMELRSNHGG